MKPSFREIYDENGLVKLVFITRSQSPHLIVGFGIYDFHIYKFMLFYLSIYLSSLFVSIYISL